MIKLHCTSYCLCFLVQQFETWLENYICFRLENRRHPVGLLSRTFSQNRILTDCFKDLSWNLVKEPDKLLLVYIWPRLKCSTVAKQGRNGRSSITKNPNHFYSKLFATYTGDIFTIYTFPMMYLQLIFDSQHVAN
jgi:hypothetical protein